MTGFQKTFWFLLIPLSCLMAIALVLFALGHLNLAFMVTNLGTPMVLLTVLFYIIFFDSRKRWPVIPWNLRLARVVTFQR